jgi:hypothetical protein
LRGALPLLEIDRKQENDAANWKIKVTYCGFKMRIT